MSAVVDFISDAVSDVADVVVGAVEDVADFAVEQIIEPVADFAVDTLQKAIDDPIGTIALVASIAYPPFAPLIQGAATLAKGGDLSDALKSAAVSYVAVEGGKYVGQIANEAATAAQYGTELGSAQTAALAAQEAGMGGVGSTVGNIAASGTRAAIRGDDPLAAMLSGGINVGVQELSRQIPGFSDLPPQMQTAAKNAMSAQLQGRDPTAGLMNTALNAGVNAIKDYKPSMEYEYDPAANPADPNADSNPDFNGLMTDAAPSLAPAPIVEEAPSLAPAPIVGDEPSMGVDQSGYPAQDLGVTDANMASFQDAQQSMADTGGMGTQWVPNPDGTYTMTYDDGSSVIADSAGNILSSTDASDMMYTGTSSSGGAPTAAPRVGPAQQALTPAQVQAQQLAQAQQAQQQANFLGGNDGLSYGTRTESSPAARLAQIDRFYDVGGTSIFNDPDDVKSRYATGGSIEDLMRYLKG